MVATRIFKHLLGPVSRTIATSITKSNPYFVVLGIPAPAVTASGNNFVVAGTDALFTSLVQALTRSCDNQVYLYSFVERYWFLLTLLSFRKMHVRMLPTRKEPQRYPSVTPSNSNAKMLARDDQHSLLLHLPFNLALRVL